MELETNTAYQMLSMEYAAPELLEEGEVTEKVDVYSYSLLMYVLGILRDQIRWEIFSNKRPFGDTSIIFVIKQVTSGQRPHPMPPVPHELQDIIHQLVHL